MELSVFSGELSRLAQSMEELDGLGVSVPRRLAGSGEYFVVSLGVPVVAEDGFKRFLKE